MLVGCLAHTQTKCVGECDQDQELTQFVAAAQVAVFQLKAAPFQVLKILLNGPAPGVELLQIRQAGGAKEEEEEDVAPSQRFDPALAPDPVDLPLSKAAHLPNGQLQVGNGLALAMGIGQQLMPGQAHDKIQPVVF